MILDLKQLQNLSKTILNAVDDTSNIMSETLELKTDNKQLLLSVTNGDYFVTVKMDIDTDETLNAVVDAKLFLNLVSKLTAETVDLTATDNCLNIKANGNYKLPFITDGNGVIVLSPIILDNKTLEFTIDNEILKSILRYNSKELLKIKGVKDVSPLQRLYYIDEQGCITFTSGACINNFTLEKPVKMLLNTKLVNLFDLFIDSKVNFSLGYDQLPGTETIQTKICLEDSQTKITSIILNDPSMLVSAPITLLRSKANSLYPYSVDIDKASLLQTINRLILFNPKSKEIYTKFTFSPTSVTITDTKNNNNETINYATAINNLENSYETAINIFAIKLVIEACQEKYITLNFGNNQAIMISRGQIKNIIPEVH